MLNAILGAGALLVVLSVLPTTVSANVVAAPVAIYNFIKGIVVKPAA